MLLYGLRHSSIRLSLCHFLAGGRLFSAILQVPQPCFKCGSHFCLARFYIFF
jgi:uncharacterized protein (DUF983 family)